MKSSTPEAANAAPSASARLKIVMKPDIAIGPGKADVLEGIKETGSIAATGRRLGMSYKRAWMLVETMNGCFKEPLVSASRGGSARGGATLTPSGELVLRTYRRMERLTQQAIADDMDTLRALLVDRG
ncbi:MAG: LysR family transcriptional regulator [Gammaproteobacteria bacterium]|nr:LysR family transcriptional regulator [Gammaproteobacteria bacterium]